MSALPPTADVAIAVVPCPLCAISRQSALQHFVTPDANRAHCSFKRLERFLCHVDKGAQLWR
jgi:hypothetical protein